MFYNIFTPQDLGDLVQSTRKEREAGSVLRGDVFLTRTSETMEDLGKSSVALRDYEEATFNGFTKRLRPKMANEIVPEYAGYYFRSPRFRQEVTAMSSLSTRASLNNSMLSALSIVLPPVDIQESIGFTLKALDDKIDLNRRMNETLEAMARALFKSWFVDFDPVRAKMEGREPFGMDPATAALFPDRLVESEIGLIPEGWEVTTIGEVTQVLGGGTPSTKESRYWEGGTHPFVTPKDMSTLTSSILFETSRCLTEAGVEKVSSKQLPVDTVLMSSRAPIGYLALAKIPISVNQGIIALQCDERATHHWAIEWCRSAMDEILSRAGGSTFAEISKKAFRPIPCILPQQKVMYSYDVAAKALMDSVTANVLQSRILAELRDLLLPKLLSGEIRVADAEKEVEDVL